MNEIKDQNDLRKLEAYLRVKARGRFSFNPELLKDLMAQLKNHAERLNVDITLETFDGTARQALLFTSGGALIGGVVGFMLAYTPGALVGIIVGAAMGSLLGSITLSLRYVNEEMILEID